MKIQKIHREQDDFIKLTKEIGTVFSSLLWLAIFDDRLELFGIYRNDELDGFFVLYKTQLKGIKTLACPPYTPHINLCYKNNAKSTALRNKKTKDVTRLVSEYLHSRNEKIILLSLPPEIIDTQAFQWDSFKVIPRYTYRIKLNKHEDDILAAMDSKTRNLVKRSSELSYVGRERIKEIQDLIKSSLVEKSADQDIKVYDRIFEKFSQRENSYVVGIEENAMITAGALFIFDEKCMYYLLGGGDKNEKNIAAGTGLIWKGIQKSRELDLLCFDFEGSMIPEIERFFRGFGGDITPYYSINKASTLLEFPLKRKFKHIF